MKEPYEQYANNLEDFWQRRRSEIRYTRNAHVFGHPFQVAANEERLLETVGHSLPLFSQAPPLARRPFRVHLIATPERSAAVPPPDSIFDHIWYTGADHWLMLHLGPWGHAYVDLEKGQATAVLAPSLAARPAVVSHSLLNTILLNFCLYRGYGMLHASCLARGDRALLLMAPHNTGKSTTALHLVMNGYQLLTDSMVHVSPYHAERSLLCGFPVGKIKLRRDMVSSFPRLHALLAAEQVRDETKFTLDLRQFDPNLVNEDAWSPATVDLCLLERHDARQSEIQPVAEEAVWSAAMQNTIFYDQKTVWERNLTSITPLLESARSHRLIIGSDPADIVRTINTLWLA